MAKITYLDPEDTGSISWHGKTFPPNKAVKVDDKADAVLIGLATQNAFFEVSGLDGEAKETEVATAAAREAAAAAEQERLDDEEEAAELAAEETRKASEAITKPGEAAKAAAAAVKQPGASK